MDTVRQGKQLIVEGILCLLFLVACTSTGHEMHKRENASGPQAPVTFQPVTKDTSFVIEPGQGIGSLRLGDSRDRAVEVLGKPSAEYNYGALTPCIYTELHWQNNDPRTSHWGIFAYLKNNRIYQLQVDAPGYATPGGIKSESSPEEIRLHHSQIQTYVLLNSGSKVVGGRDLIYWVDEEAGISYELFYDVTLEQRRVLRIIVFEPKTQFLPKGCISPPKEWRRLAPFTVDTP